MLNFMNKKRKKTGFTLIELIIVIAIIAILAAVAVPKYLQVKENANIKADIAAAKELASETQALIADEKFSKQSDFTIDLSNTSTGDAAILDKALDGSDYKAKAKEANKGTFKVVVDADQNVKIKKIDANSIKEALLYIINLINFTDKLIEYQSKQQIDFERITAYLNNLEH